MRVLLLLPLLFLLAACLSDQPDPPESPKLDVQIAKPEFDQNVQQPEPPQQKRNPLDF